MKKKRKIFKPKRHYKIKRHNVNTVKIITGVAVVAALVFVGYSAAGPISKFAKTRAQQQTVTEAWEPGQTDDAAADYGDISSDISAAAETQGTTAPSVSTLPPATSAEELPTVKTSENIYEPIYTEPDVTETTAVSETGTQPMSEIRSGGAALSLAPEDMVDMDSLEAALEDLRAGGASAVIMPMKTAGGYFYYNTDIPFVSTVTDGGSPIMSEVTAYEAAQAARALGLRPVALVSVLKDNNRYGDYRDGSYKSYDGDTWLDASPEDGGKPWLSPFEQTTQEYLCDIMRELGNAGFEEIICEDFVFPEFRSSDIEIIGDYVEPYGSTRYKALTSLADMMTQAGQETGARVLIRITANSIIKDYSEIFHPDLLSRCTLLIDYSENNIADTMISDDEEIILDDMALSEKIRTVISEVQRYCGDIPTEVFIDRGAMSADEFAAAVSAVSGMGYEGYYVY